MKRKIIEIDEAKCNGCGQCADACAEGAIKIVDGKAKLVADTYCDGLGACIGKCPQDAITIVEREAADFDEAKAKAHVDELKQKQAAKSDACHGKLPCGCPGTAARALTPEIDEEECCSCGCEEEQHEEKSRLRNWPVQLALVPVLAPYLQGADLLLAADCVPFAYAGFHKRFLGKKQLVIACPKLDDAQAHIEKLAAVLRQAKIASLAIVHMEVPCCGGLTRIAEEALRLAGAAIPVTDITVSLKGEIIEERELAAG